MTPANFDALIEDACAEPDFAIFLAKVVRALILALDAKYEPAIIKLQHRLERGA